MWTRGREVTLMLDNKIGRALLTVCAWSHERDRVLSKIRREVRMGLFSNMKYLMARYP